MKGSLDCRSNVEMLFVRKDVIEGLWGHYRRVLDEGEDADRGGCLVR